jgi:hypothetical protein
MAIAHWTDVLAVWFKNRFRAFSYEIASTALLSRARFGERGDPASATAPPFCRLASIVATVVDSSGWTFPLMPGLFLILTHFVTAVLPILMRNNASLRLVAV